MVARQGHSCGHKSFYALNLILSPRNKTDMTERDMEIGEFKGTDRYTLGRKMKKVGVAYFKAGI
jgi:hypothetical protein